MFPLHKIKNSNIFKCPKCNQPLEVKNYYIPGMRCLADSFCKICKEEYYYDLPALHGLYYPMLINKKTSVVYDKNGQISNYWFARWLRDSYTSRSREKIQVEIDLIKKTEKSIFINCLDKIFGHSLLKLLNAQYYIDNENQKGVVLLIPKSMKWLVPDGVVEVWSVDVSFKDGNFWNDDFANFITQQINRFSEFWLSPTFAHPHPLSYNIEKFTKIAPFSRDKWEKLLDKPKITFIFRNDRLWVGKYPEKATVFTRVSNNLKNSIPKLKKLHVENEILNITTYAEKMKRMVPNLDFSVVGVGKLSSFPNWIKDMRVDKIDEAIELQWCKRYSESHLVVGVCGSNMLLPSALAGATIDIMPHDRWTNLGQDILFRDCQQREAIYYYRFIPCSVEPSVLARISYTVLFERIHHTVLMNSEWSNQKNIVNENLEDWCKLYDGEISFHVE